MSNNIAFNIMNKKAWHAKNINTKSCKYNKKDRDSYQH